MEISKKTLGVVVNQDEDGVVETECTYSGFNRLELLGILDIMRDEIIADMDTMDAAPSNVTIQ